MRVDLTSPLARYDTRSARIADGAAPESSGNATDQLFRLGLEPEIRVAREFSYGPNPSRWQKFKARIQGLLEFRRSGISPGTYLARHSEGGKHGIRVVRKDTDEERIPVEGLSKIPTGWAIKTTEGDFDPRTFRPSLVFHPKEDSFPTKPDLDGDGNLKTDAANYKHGVIGGNQPLTGVSHVSKKGEYTVITYSLYYVDNKAATFHLKDSSTLAVYLKPGKDGTLEPNFLYTSWHYGANLAKWDDLKKDAKGHPIVEVERGSHALHPLAKKERPWKKGVHANGDGSVAWRGKDLPNAFTWLAFQPGIPGTTAVDAADPRSRPLMDAYFAKFPERTNPIHPSLFN